MRIDEKFQKTARPEKVIQFGEGGFLRGFVDWMLQKLNDSGAWEGGVVVVQPIEQGMCDMLESQSCMYTHIIRGVEGTQEQVVDVICRCVKPYDDYESYLKLADDPGFRFIVSNTTEAGIAFRAEDKLTDAPPVSYPAKLTQLLYRRYQKGLPGFVLLPCELIDRNGDKLKACVLQYAKLWELGEGFVNWIETENHFCCTLVDRINTGYPKDNVPDLGYEDKLINTSEYFHLWVIEGPEFLGEELPFHKMGLNVVWTKDLERYRTRKVRILNGAHTATVAYALLSGVPTVREAMEDGTLHTHICKCVFEEIIPTVTTLTREELESYAEAVLQRFSNPHIQHFWADISLNSVSKFKVRVLPSLIGYYEKFGKLPPALCRAFGCLIRFYKEGTPKDDAAIVEDMKKLSVKEILARTDWWDADCSFAYDEVVKYASESQ